MARLSDEKAQIVFRSYTKWLGLVLLALITLPMLYGVLLRPAGSLYLGFQYNFDDQMVYAGWMKQAAEGRLLFENRFTPAEQPGLTLNLYFLVLGWISKLIGIPAATFLARIVTSFIAVQLVGRLIEKVTPNIFHRKVCLALSVFGMGLGFLVWHNYGTAIVKPAPELLGNMLSGALPIDTWQPEAFLFSSALTNGLFTASLCLILVVFLCVIKARDSASALVPGAVCAAVLMNIHSYDVLLVAFVLVGFAVALWGSKRLTTIHVSRTVLIGLGVLPFALWFAYVLQHDAVFQARAATPTFAPKFHAMIGGLITLMTLAIFGLKLGARSRWLFAALAAAFFVVMCVATYHKSPVDGYLLTPIIWAALYSGILLALYLFRPSSDGMALIIAWAFVGLLAPYFPALFQRKLAMMIGIPWGILAGIGLATVLEKRERSKRNLLTALMMLVPIGSNIQWVSREFSQIRQNVSNTTVHDVYLSADAGKILRLLEPFGRRAVVVAVPGIPNPAQSESGEVTLDQFAEPIITDLNPLVVGLNGNRSIAAHWSETPNYGKARSEVTKLLQAGDRAALQSLGCTHVILPMVEGSPFAKPESFGNILFRGSQFVLVQL